MDLDGDLEEDPIALCMQARTKVGGLDRQISELDALKQKLVVPKAATTRSLSYCYSGELLIIMLAPPMVNARNTICD